MVNTSSRGDESAVLIKRDHLHNKALPEAQVSPEVVIRGDPPAEVMA